MSLSEYPLYMGRKISNTNPNPSLDVPYVISGTNPPILYKRIVTNSGHSLEKVNTTIPYIFYDVATEIVSLVDPGQNVNQAASNPQAGFQQGFMQFPQAGFQQGFPQAGFQQGFPQAGFQQGFPQTAYDPYALYQIPYFGTTNPTINAQNPNTTTANTTTTMTTTNNPTTTTTNNPTVNAQNPTTTTTTTKQQVSSSDNDPKICKIQNLAFTFPTLGTTTQVTPLPAGFNSCTNGIAQILADQNFIFTPSSGLPLLTAPSAIIDFDVKPAALRFGNLNLTDVTSLFGVGSEAFGNNQGGNFYAFGSGSEAYGVVDNSSIIQTGAIAAVSSSFNPCCLNTGKPDNSIKQSGFGKSPPSKLLTTCSLAIINPDDLTPVNPADIGYGAEAHGYSTQQGLIEAYGGGSTAAGVACGGTIQAIGDGSIAVGVAKCGENNIACGLASGVFGRNNHAVEPYSFAFGYNGYAYLYGSSALSSFPVHTEGSFISVDSKNYLIPPNSCNVPTAPYTFNNVLGGAQNLRVMTVGVSVITSSGSITLVCNSSSSCATNSYGVYTLLALGNSVPGHIAIPVLPFDNGAANVKVSVVSPRFSNGGTIVGGAFSAEYEFLVTVTPQANNGNKPTYNVVANLDPITGQIIPSTSNYETLAFTPTGPPPVAYPYPNNENSKVNTSGQVCNGFSIVFVETVNDKVCNTSGQCIQNPAVGNLNSSNCLIISSRTFVATIDITMVVSSSIITTYCIPNIDNSRCTGVYPCDPNSNKSVTWTNLFNSCCNNNSNSVGSSQTSESTGSGSTNSSTIKSSLSSTDMSATYDPVVNTYQGPSAPRTTGNCTTCGHK
ncbi:MAG: hypothetical protein ACYCST_21680 [Acidimicrobiales bacterium]